MFCLLIFSTEEDLKNSEEVRFNIILFEEISSYDQIILRNISHFQRSIYVNLAVFSNIIIKY